jgi:hypothetical protein
MPDEINGEYITIKFGCDFMPDEINKYNHVGVLRSWYILL